MPSSSVERRSFFFSFSFLSSFFLFFLFFFFFWVSTRRPVPHAQSRPPPSPGLSCKPWPRCPEPRCPRRVGKCRVAPADRPWAPVGPRGRSGEGRRGRGGVEGGHRRPPASSRGPSGRLRPRRHAGLRESPPAPRGAAACDPERSGGPRGESEAWGPGSRGAGGGQAQSRAAGEDSRGRARRAAAPGGCRCGGRGEAAACGKLAGARSPAPRGGRSRPAALVSNYCADGPERRCPCLHAQLAKQRTTARATRAGVPHGTFLERMTLVRSLKTFRVVNFWRSESN